MNQPSECGMTALHLAVWHRHPEAVKVLLQAKVNPYLVPDFVTAMGCSVLVNTPSSSLRLMSTAG